MAIRNRAVNFQQHLFLLILDDLQRLGTPFPDRPKDCRSLSTINRVQSRFTPGNWKLIGRRLQVSCHQTSSVSDFRWGHRSCQRSIRKTTTSGAVIRLLGPVGDHLPSLGSLPSPGHLGVYHRRRRHRTNHRHVSLETHQNYPVTNQRLRGIPVSTSNLGLGDIGLLGSSSISTILGVSPEFISSERTLPLEALCNTRPTSEEK
jgi:hypothetical protein